MTGRIIEVNIRVGDIVEPGSTLAILEAMKMEHRLTAPARARVIAVAAASGQRVSVGDNLFELAPETALEPRP